jgi:16S rRNA processing protein RimM
VPAEPFVGLTLARILRPWGRRGEVAAEILTDYPQRLASLTDVWLNDGRTTPRLVRLRSCRIHLGQAVLHFEGCDSISQAEQLRGCEVQVPLAERSALPPDQHYISDLVGCSVSDAGTGETIGTVRDVQNAAEAGAPASWLLVVEVEREVTREVERESGNARTANVELLVPLSAEICTLIDTAARRIEVRLPNGLLDLTENI